MRCPRCNLLSVLNGECFLCGWSAVRVCITDPPQPTQAGRHCSGRFRGNRCFGPRLLGSKKHELHHTPVLVRARVGGGAPPPGIKRIEENRRE